MQGREDLDTAGYSQRVKELSKEWKQLDEAERLRYEARAGYENECRKRLQDIPLPTDGAEDVAETKIAGKKACKKLSYKRLQVNQSQYNDCPSWPGCLKLQCSEAALRSDLIDVEVSDATVSEKLNEVMHCAAVTPEENECQETTHQPCWNRYGMCETAEHCELVAKLVRQFGKFVQDKGLLPGALLKVSRPDIDRAEFFFLGVVVVRPRSQCFLKAMEVEGVVHLLITDGLPHISTSQQFFQKLLVDQSESGPFHKFIVDEYNYTCAPKYLPSLQVTVGSHVQSFELLNIIPRRPKKARTVLPFSLQMPKKRCTPARN